MLSYRVRSDMQQTGTERISSNSEFEHRPSVDCHTIFSLTTYVAALFAKRSTPTAVHPAPHCCWSPASRADGASPIISSAIELNDCDTQEERLACKTTRAIQSHRCGLCSTHRRAGRAADSRHDRGLGFYSLETEHTSHYCGGSGADLEIRDSQRKFPVNTAS
jgi:hypothetical protein